MNANNQVLQSLLHDSLLATGHVESCAIFKKKDGAIKSASAGYEVCNMITALMVDAACMVACCCG